MEDFRYKDLTRVIIGAAMKVHTRLGNGYQEKIYQRACDIEFTKNKLKFIREFPMKIFYDNILIGNRRVDFLVDDLISVELKAVARLEDVHLAQALNYLEILNLQVGLLLNFGAPSLEVKRLLNKKFKQ